MYIYNIWYIFKCVIELINPTPFIYRVMDKTGTHPYLNDEKGPAKYFPHTRQYQEFSF